MIINNETDILQLKRWDPRVAQEYLDTVASMIWELDADLLYSVHKKREDKVNKHIEKLDKELEQEIKKTARQRK